MNPSAWQPESDLPSSGKRDASRGASRFTSDAAMIAYRLPRAVTFCLVNGRPLFLDLTADLYFRLSGETERAFTSYLEHQNPDVGSYLLERGVLTVAPPGYVLEPASFPRAEASALEHPHTAALPGPLVALEVLLIVFWTKFRLATCSIDVVLRRLADSLARTNPCSPINEELLVRYTHAFLSIRRLIPIPTCCLPDSVALACFLTRRKLPFHIVIGITDDPFSAHCWVQLGNMVLNDTVGNTRVYTVIRVI